MATGNSYHTISKVFRISLPSVNGILLQFCTVLNLIATQFIKFSVMDVETRDDSSKFRAMLSCSIPQVLGCVDDTYIEIIYPDTESKVDYFNRKQTYYVKRGHLLMKTRIF